MSLKDSWDRILFTFDSGVVMEVMEMEQRGLMQVAYCGPWYGKVLHSYTVKLQETKSQTHINNRLYFCAYWFL